MWANGVGNLVLIEEIMKRMNLAILQKNLAPSAAKLNLKGYCFFKDKHFPLEDKQWMLYTVKKVQPHSPQSRDLNLIEYLWAYMETKLRVRKVNSNK